MRTHYPFFAAAILSCSIQAVIAQDKPASSEQPEKEKEALRISFADLPPEACQPRTIALFGDLDEEAVEDVCMGLITLKIMIGMVMEY